MKHFQPLLLQNLYSLLQPLSVSLQNARFISDPVLFVTKEKFISQQLIRPFLSLGAKSSWLNYEVLVP